MPLIIILDYLSDIPKNSKPVAKKQKTVEVTSVDTVYPALGVTWSHCVNTRLIAQFVDSHVRQVRWYHYLFVQKKIKSFYLVLYAHSNTTKYFNKSLGIPYCMYFFIRRISCKLFLILYVNRDNNGQ